MEHVSSSVTLVETKKRSLVPEKWEDQVRVIGISECKEAALSLAQAFATDELAQYLLDAEEDGDESKWRLHVDIFNYIVAAHCYKGVVTTIGPDYEAVALWMPPGKDSDDWLTILRSGMWRLYYQLSAEGRRRYYNELLPVLHQTKHEVMGDRDDDCYYLVYLGTKPSGQRRGYARKLIDHMAAKADAEGRAMYLESSSLKNNGYYKKFGFEIKRDLYLGADVAAAAAASASSAVTTTTITTTTSNSSDDNNSDSGSAAHAPVLLTIMRLLLAPAPAGRVVKSDYTTIGDRERERGEEEERKMEWTIDNPAAAAMLADDGDIDMTADSFLGFGLAAAMLA
ncbi:hypothetical protein CIB48_g9497 [Xylaria polymorpha]|nr:hypothetical protein CIB48_g9497 [Xylaria polymorpha]